MTFQELKPTILRLQNAAPGSYGPVEVVDEAITVAVAEYQNGWAAGTEQDVIRRFKVDGKPVDLLKAARILAESEA